MADISRACCGASVLSSHASIGVVVSGVLGDFDLGQLTHDDLKYFVRVRRQQTVKPHGAQDTGRRVSDPTIRKNLSTISAVYKHVMDLELPNAPRVNPLKTFDRSNLKTSRKVDRHLRANQFEEILAACKKPVHRTMLVVLVGTGMRSGDPSHARTHDFFDDGRLRSPHRRLDGRPDATAEASRYRPIHRPDHRSFGWG